MSQSEKDKNQQPAPEKPKVDKALLEQSIKDKQKKMATNQIVKK